MSRPQPPRRSLPLAALALRYAASIIEVARSLGLPLYREGVQVFTRCVFHEDTGRPNMVLYEKTGTFKCFRSGCGDAGDVTDLVKQVLNLPTGKAAAVVEALAGMEGGQAALPISLSGKKAMNPLALGQLEAYIAKCEVILRQTPKALAYWHGQGFPDQTIKRFRLGFDDGTAWKAARPDAKWSPYRNRLIIPLIGADGKPAYFAIRVLTDGRKPKYKNAPGAVPGLFRTFREEDKTVFLCEGPVDAITLAQAGFPAASGLGTEAVQPGWLVGKRWLIVYDNDEPGGEGVGKLMAVLRAAGIKAENVRLLEGVGDVNEFWLKDKEDLFGSSRRLLLCTCDHSCHLSRYRL